MSDAISMGAGGISLGALVLSYLAFRRTTWQKPKVVMRASAEVIYEPEQFLRVSLSLTNKGSVGVDIWRVKLARRGELGPELDRELYEDQIINQVEKMHIIGHRQMQLEYRVSGFKARDGRTFSDEEACKALTRHGAAIIFLSDGNTVEKVIRRRR